MPTRAGLGPLTRSDVTMMDAELNKLLNDFPLSPQWDRPSLVRHVARVGDAQIHLAGLSAVDRTGQCVVGSAGQLAGSPLARAYFELIERMAVVEAMNKKNETFEILDVRNEVVSNARNTEVFLQSSDEQNWRYARSNGVAVGVGWDDSSSRARLELAERDRVLRSWFGEFTPERVELSLGMVPGSLDQHYEFETYLFTSPNAYREAVTVVGIFGFPKQQSAPLVFGFGARLALQDALTTAACECLQRLGFLWGEAIPADFPSFAPTPDFHQEYYLHPPNQAQLRAWLRGAHTRFAGILLDSPPSEGITYFVNLTPESLRSKLVVVKALPAGELPLTFGRGHPRLRRAPPDPLAIHPIA